ncbi:MAG: hypothetical protein E6H55_00145 [Betaproteobacteria bacterium]|nr:MAG: hypothetical protein E6H55_00145 [Betaproteobacteria bacterium]
MSDRRVRRSLAGLTGLHLRLLCDLQSIVDLDPKISHGALKVRANKMRVETKSYVMQDYDLANFRFKK